MFRQQVLFTDLKRGSSSTETGDPFGSNGVFEKNRRFRSNEKGFALVLLIPVLSVLLAVCFFFFMQAHLVLTDRESRAVCRSELLTAQEKSGKNITALLDLNPKIARLKKAKKTAEAMIELAIATQNGPLFTAGQAALKVAEAGLIGARAAQLTLLAQAHFALIQGQRSVRQKLHEVWKNRDRSRGSLQGVRGHLDVSVPPHVAVRPADPTDPYPEYVLEENFSERQTLQIFWKTEFDRSKEHRTWTHQDWTLQRNCAATLVPKGTRNEFSPVLNEAKFSWKSSFFF